MYNLVYYSMRIIFHFFGNNHTQVHSFKIAIIEFFSSLFFKKIRQRPRV